MEKYHGMRHEDQGGKLHGLLSLLKLSYGLSSFPDEKLMRKNNVQKPHMMQCTVRYLLWINKYIHQKMKLIKK